MARETRDINAEKRHYNLHGEHKHIYKLKKLNEPGGSPIGILGRLLEINKLANFGLGIGLYFHTLINLCMLSIISGAILIPVILRFDASSYGVRSNDPRLGGTAACSDTAILPEMCENVGGTSMCNFLCGDSACDVLYKESCEYPGNSILYADLAMCAFFAIMLVLSELWQNRRQNELDDKVQTSQDYSLVVKNPPADAEDPDEWKEFFERFGKVRYITIVRDNKNLLMLLLQKRLIIRKLDTMIKHQKYDQRAAELTTQDPSISNYISWTLGCGRSSEGYQLRQLAKLNVQINEECKSHHPVCK